MVSTFLVQLQILETTDPVKHPAYTPEVQFLPIFLLDRLVQMSELHPLEQHLRIRRHFRAFALLFQPILVLLLLLPPVTHKQLLPIEKLFMRISQKIPVPPFRFAGLDRTRFFRRGFALISASGNRPVRNPLHRMLRRVFAIMRVRVELAGLNQLVFVVHRERGQLAAMPVRRGQGARGRGSGVGGQGRLELAKLVFDFFQPKFLEIGEHRIIKLVKLAHRPKSNFPDFAQKLLIPRKLICK